MYVWVCIGVTHANDKHHWQRRVQGISEQIRHININYVHASLPPIPRVLHPKGPRFMPVKFEIQTRLFQTTSTVTLLPPSPFCLHRVATTSTGLSYRKPRTPPPNNCRHHSLDNVLAVCYPRSHARIAIQTPMQKTRRALVDTNNHHRCRRPTRRSNTPQ